MVTRLEGYRLRRCAAWSIVSVCCEPGPSIAAHTRASAVSVTCCGRLGVCLFVCCFGVPDGVFCSKMCACLCVRGVAFVPVCVCQIDCARLGKDERKMFFLLLSVVFQLRLKHVEASFRTWRSRRSVPVRTHLYGQGCLWHLVFVLKKKKTLPRLPFRAWRIGVRSGCLRIGWEHGCLGHCFLACLFFLAHPSPPWAPKLAQKKREEKTKKIQRNTKTKFRQLLSDRFRHLNRRKNCKSIGGEQKTAGLSTTSADFSAALFVFVFPKFR